MSEKTESGYENPKCQMNLGWVCRISGDPVRDIYHMACLDPKCRHRYGAFQFDLHQRKCPKCQGGEPCSNCKGKGCGLCNEVNPHHRHRKFNTRDTYPEQNLDNDLCQVVLARGTLVFVRGQVGQEIDGFASLKDAGAGEQAEQAMRNLAQLLREVGAELSHICRIQVYLTERADRDAVYRAIGKRLKGVYPVSTGLIVRGLARPEWLMEIEATAVIPEAGAAGAGGAR